MLNTYLQVALKSDNPCRVILHWLIIRTRSFLGPCKMAAAAIFWLHFLNNRSSIHFFEISVVEPYIISVTVTGNLHDCVIYIQLPESFRAFFFPNQCCHWNPFLIRLIVTGIPLGLQNLNKKEQNNNVNLIICCQVCGSSELSNCICEKMTLKISTAISGMPNKFPWLYVLSWC